MHTATQQLSTLPVLPMLDRPTSPTTGAAYQETAADSDDQEAGNAGLLVRAREQQIDRGERISVAAHLATPRRLVRNGLHAMIYT